MTTRFYPAAIAPAACGSYSYGVYFPDLSGCTSGSRSFRETAEHAARALALNCGTARSGLLAELVRQATAAPLPTVETRGTAQSPVQRLLSLMPAELGHIDQVSDWLVSVARDARIKLGIAVENVQTTLQLFDVTLGAAEKGYPVGVREKAG